MAGVDLGGTKIQTVAVRAKQVAGSQRVMTPRGTAEDVVQTIAESVRGALAASSLPPERLKAVGIGSPGKVDPTTGIVSQAANVPGLEGTTELGTLVSQALGGIPVRVDNDVRSALWGEFVRGAGRPYRNVLGVFVGTGVGGGMVLEGRLRHGRGAAGEIGHTVVKEGGRRCGCGRRGCLEAYAGRASMEAHARKLHARGDKTILFELMQKRGRDRLTSGVIDEALERGDEMAAGLIDDAVWALGIAVANAHNLLDVEAVLVGGGLGDRLGVPFVTRISKAMRPHLFVPQQAPSMLPTGMGDLSGAVGAAIIAGG